MKNGIAGHARPAMGGGLAAGKLRMLSSGVVLLALSCAPMPGEEGAVGQQASEIINGTVVAPGTMAGMGIVNIVNGSTCTGTIVNSRYVLTALHCYSGNVPFASWPLWYADSNGVTQVRYGESFQALSVPCGNTMCGDISLIKLRSSEPGFNIANSHNPDAPFARNFFDGDLSTMVGQSFTQLGYGNGTCGAGAGVLRQGNFQVARLQRWPALPAPGSFEFFEVDPNPLNQIGTQGDSGSAAFIGPAGYERIFGVMKQASCNYSDFNGPRTFRDGVMNIVGAHNSPKAFYAIPNTGGALTEYWHIGQASRTGNWIWNQVGSGWSFREVAQDGSILYAVDSAGNVRWYRHDGHYDVYGGHWGARSGTIIQSGFNVRHVLAGGNGVLYTVDAFGNMRWYRHNARHVGQFGNVNVGQPDWTGGNIIRNLSQYSHITTAGDGIFYLRESNGNVYWMRYNNHLTGAVGGFTSPVYLMNIPGVKDLVARPDGYLYYSESSSSGILYQAKHLGYLTGANSWATPSGSSSTPHFASVGSGWNNLHILGSSPAL